MNSKVEVIVRMAVPGDLDFISQRSGLAQGVLLQKIGTGEIFLLIVNGEPVGQLHLGFLWSEIPMIDLIYINEPFRKHGFSRVLLGFLEDHLRERGYVVLYSSSQLDEPQPQAWHRYMGFEECGVINGLNAAGIGEVFFRKAL